MLAWQKTLIILIIFISGSLKGNSQKRYTAFPKTTYQIILPDTSFKINYDSTGFFSEKYSAKLSVDPFETKDNKKYDYDFLVKLLLLEMSRPGNTILMDKKIDSNHQILKVKIDFDLTDLAPAEKGVSNILWVYLINENGEPLVLNGEYRLKYDTVLGDLFLTSFQTFSPKKE
jgi:hypothetical protein